MRVAKVRSHRFMLQGKRILITGGGTILSGAGNSVGDLSERFDIPIQTTPAGRGSVAETHPLFCGLTGLYRTTFPRDVYESADLLITVGSRMEEFHVHTERDDRDRAQAGTEVDRAFSHRMASSIS